MSGSVLMELIVITIINHLDQVIVEGRYISPLRNEFVITTATLMMHIVKIEQQGICGRRGPSLDQLMMRMLVMMVVVMLLMIIIMMVMVTMLVVDLVGVLYCIVYRY